MDVANRILLAAWRHPFAEPDSEAGLARLRAMLGPEAREEEVRAALAGAVAAGLLRDPVRLPPGALQCHWQLDLTPAGLAAARAQAGGAEEAEPHA